MNVYDFTVLTQSGEKKSLKDFEGKVLVIFNSATECGFTPQYEGLEKMRAKYEGEDVEFLEFPCNQFGGQAPGTDDEINNFCTLRYGTKLKRFKKIDVNGEIADPLFKYLYSEKGFKGFDTSKDPGKMLDGYIRNERPDYDKSDDIKWNFTKFVVDRKGNVVSRIEPTEGLEPLEEAIEKVK